MSNLTLKQYVVDAFTDKVFKGNPAAVCVLDSWLPDALMQSIAIENNLSETAFTVREGDRYRLRWFTPGGEIDLCGHATLGTAYVLLNFYEPESAAVTFETRSGELIVRREGELYEMDMPAYELRQVPVTDEMERAIGVRPRAHLKTANTPSSGSFSAILRQFDLKSTKDSCVKLPLYSEKIPRC